MLYITPLSYVIQSHGLDHHLYADDTHIYIYLATPYTNYSLIQLRDSLQDVLHWINDCKLKLNTDKRKCIIIGTQKQRDKFNVFADTYPEQEFHTESLSTEFRNYL